MNATSFDIHDGIALPLAVIDIIRANRDHLSELDGAAGDGDHGINMAKGMSLAQTRIAAEEARDLTNGFAIISDVLLSQIGGSMGPLYGGFFRGISVASREKDAIDSEAFGQLLAEGVRRLRRVTDAQVGDKTLIDVLVPALSAYQNAATAGASFGDALAEMNGAAQEGLQSTKDMVARIGRSSRLGERSVGHLDAGAASCALILQAMSRSAANLLTKGDH
ncbi:dihydroxyacetone kinase subunit DhaL [Glycomyces tenuis]|uniref:dihydroxyacetone kinase subunit DhaL n=1 Tax=Glycomyces tenuis TaxID=58116 RepID=UPI0003FD1889|nr:dihydroxyacetone kinase subunit DhaL [Glycomyces tenuis]